MGDSDAPQTPAIGWDDRDGILVQRHSESWTTNEVGVCSSTGCCALSPVQQHYGNLRCSSSAFNGAITGGIKYESTKQVPVISWLVSGIALPTLEAVGKGLNAYYTLWLGRAGDGDGPIVDSAPGVGSGVTVGTGSFNEGTNGWVYA